MVISSTLSIPTNSQLPKNCPPHKPSPSSKVSIANRTLEEISILLPRVFARIPANIGLQRIWKETDSVTKAGFYNNNGKKVLIGKPGETTRFTYDALPAERSRWNSIKCYVQSFWKTQVSVVNQDAVYAAMDLKKKGYKVAILNPASPDMPGGGTRRGTPAMEEDLCRRSILLSVLKKLRFPLGNTLLYTADVPFFRYGRDRKYAFMPEPVSISVISSAAIDLNPWHGGGKWTKEAFEEETRLRVFAQFQKAAEEGNNAVVLTAFGCGEFRNDPNVVARIYRDVLETHFKGAFSNVTFAIIDDRNAKKKPRGNYLPFYEVFVEGKQ